MATMPYTTTAPLPPKHWQQRYWTLHQTVARNSITAVTSLPFLAASAKICTISEFAPLRYKVCLMAKHADLAASRNNRITGKMIQKDDAIKYLVSASH